MGWLKQIAPIVGCIGGTALIGLAVFGFFGFPIPGAVLGAMVGAAVGICTAA